MNYEILISVSLGDNLPLQEEFLSRACKTTAILEAKFNEEVLQSDPILIDSVNPELATELGFRLNKKDFQQFRIERKSIKLQCFVDYSTLPDERHFIGYVVLQIRDIQEYTGGSEPKYRWHILLNPKYKGSSMKRPQLYLAFMVNRLNDGASDEMTNSMTSQTSLTSGCGGGLSLSESHHECLESAFIRPLRKEPSPAMSSSVHGFPLLQNAASSGAHEFDSNLKVKLKSRTFYVWDENRCREADCSQMYLIQIQIDRPRNLANLLGDKKAEADDKKPNTTEYHFKYTMLGKQIRSASFFDLERAADYRRHRFLFPILTYDVTMLQEYFESYPTVEIRLCSVRNSVVIGFVTANLLRLFENASAAIEGDYMIVPEDESVYVKEPFPVVQLKLAISRMDSQHSSHSLARTPVLSRRKVDEAEGGQIDLNRSAPTPTPSEDNSTSSLPATNSAKDKLCQQKQGKPPLGPSSRTSLSPPLPAANQPVNHYYISIDLRTIRLTTSEHAAASSPSSSPSSPTSSSNSGGQQNFVLLQPFYLQFSYAFFGISDFIKTYPAIRFAAAQPQAAITVPHGFCGFNFATTREKLEYTFSTVPFIVTLHLEADDTLLGTAKLDLSCLLRQKSRRAEEVSSNSNGQQEQQPQLGDDQFVNTSVPVEDELNDQICELQVVMFLQEMTNLSYCADRVEVTDRRRAIVPSMQLGPKDNFQNEENLNLVSQSLNDMIIETAHDIELWKEQQMRIFKSRLKLKEQEVLADRERLLVEREEAVAGRQRELDGRLARLQAEIEAATREARNQYEEKAAGQRAALKALQEEKQRAQERLYLLERRLKEKELRIRELEAAGVHHPPQRRALSASRPTSLTRSMINSSSGGVGTGGTIGTAGFGSTGTRRIVITRDSSTPPLSKSMIDQSSKPPSAAFESRIGSPAMHHRATSASGKPPPLLKAPVRGAAPVSSSRTASSGTQSTVTSTEPAPTTPLKSSTTEGAAPLIIEKIKRERAELLKRGLSLKDPLIVEIDKRIKNYRPVNVKRI